jgi:hypothetical protein
MFPELRGRRRNDIGIATVKAKVEASDKAATSERQSCDRANDKAVTERTPKL